MLPLETAGRMPVALWALLLLLTLNESCCRAASWVPPWDIDDGSKAARDAWSRTLEVMWNKTKDQAGFCLGGSEYGVFKLLSLSFDWPLPVGPAGDAVCSNRTRVYQHLCSPLELEEYYKYMLLSTNPEKIPDTPQCTAGSTAEACAPGFFDANLLNRDAPIAAGSPHACCEGYFCPVMLTCMIPCPLGGYCPRAWAAPPPDEYKARGDNSSWCAPYAYKERKTVGCGGADRWSVVPELAFPNARWTAGRGNIYCDGGAYCPNTTAKLNCMEGYFCRQGSTEPDRCPPGVRCPPGTDIPDNAQTGVTVDALLFLGLWLVWQCSRWYGRVLRKLGTRERLRVSWGRQPEITVVAAAPEQPAQHPLFAQRSGRSEGQQAWKGDGTARNGGGVDHGAFSGDEEGGSDGEGSGVLSASDSRSLALLRALSPKRKKRRAAKEASGPVWAAFRGPEPQPDEYEELPGAFPEQSAELMPTSRSGRLGVRTWHRRTGSGVEDGEDATTPTSLHRRLLAPHRHSLVDTPLGGMHVGAAAQRRPHLTVEFRDLGLRLRSCGKVVLRGVYGQLSATRTTAIMGPSGAGKTSLLNTLSDKAPYGIQSGDVLVNGRPDTLERYKPVMGFVPQDDIMHSTLSVEENLMFSARYRLPAHYKREQHLFFVERAIQTLHLEDVRHELIGNEETRGISGGQRKRVNVGLELVADPALLFLDEPTSGLDSTASKALVAALQAVVRGGVTAAAVIHQPSFEIFEMFDDLLLLGKGGRTVFYGPQSDVQAYFEGHLGFELPTRMNPSDVYMDIISGAILRPGQEQADVAALFDTWDEFCGRHKSLTPAGSGTSSLLPNSTGENDPLLDGREAGDAARGWRKWPRRAKEALVVAAAYLLSSARDLWEGGIELCRQLDTSLLGGRIRGWGGGGQRGAEPEGEEDHRDVRRLARRRTPGFLPQYYWCLSRAILKRVREPLVVFTDYAIVALTGMTLGLISDRGRSTIMHFSVSVTYSVIALGMISKVGALPTFGRDRTVFCREAASGLNRLSFFLALDTFDHAGTLLRSAVYLVMWYSFASPRAILWQMYLVTLGITYCCSGTAYVLSQVMDPSAAQLSAAVTTLISTLIARESHPTGLIKLIKELSFARYGLEGYVISESNRLTGVWLLARCADLQGLGYDVRRFGFCLLALLGLGAAMRVIAVLCMLLLFRDKQR